MNSLTKQISGGLIVACLGMGTAFAKEYEVTITNITQGEIFTPILVASHGSDMPLFELGEAASQEVEFIAEGGDTSALNSKLISEGAYTASASGVLPPGESITLNVNTDRKHKNISVISMLVPSNDAFFAVNNIRGPKGHKSKTVYPKVYDAGTEANDELCAHIPGPPFACTGEGYSAETGEGFVHVHPGIHGDADLDNAIYDWNNPAAKVTIRRVHK